MHKTLINFTDDGNGIPLVLIHAFPADHLLWEPQVNGLKAHFRVITLDLWGFGQSAITNGQTVTMEEYADEVEQLLTQLHISKAIIAGESMGGYISLAFLEKYPNKVSGLILADTQAIPDNEEAKAKRETTALDVLAHGTSQLVEGFIPKALSANASEATKKTLKQILERQPATAVASALRGMALRNDQSELLKKTNIPVLIITGDQDVVISPEQSQAMHHLVKNSKLVTIANAGHLASLEQPAQWNQAVIEMFAQQ